MLSSFVFSSRTTPPPPVIGQSRVSFALFSFISIKACVPYLSLKWRETKGKKLCPLFVHSTSLLCNVVKRKHERSEVNEQNKAHNTLEPRSVVCFLFVFLSLVSRFHSLRSFHCKRAKQRERERDTTVDDS